MSIGGQWRNSAPSTACAASKLNVHSSTLQRESKHVYPWRTTLLYSNSLSAGQSITDSLFSVRKKSLYCIANRAETRLRRHVYILHVCLWTAPSTVTINKLERIRKRRDSLKKMWTITLSKFLLKREQRFLFVPIHPVAKLSRSLLKIGIQVTVASQLKFVPFTKREAFHHLPKNL